MSRDQRPGTVRIIAETRAVTSRKRRHDDAQGSAKNAPKSKIAPASSPVPAWRWLIIPALLFIVGFAAGGLIIAARAIIQVPGL